MGLFRIGLNNGCGGGRVSHLCWYYWRFL